MTEEWGDFSHYHPIDVNAYFDAGYETIAWKITEATTYEDPTWAAAYRITRARGKRFIGYHFDRSRFSGADQFDWFLSRWLAVAGQLRPGLDIICDDVEDTSYPAGAKTSLAQFVGRALSKGYLTGLVYSGRWYAQPYGIRLDALPVGWQNGWLSDYTVGQADTDIELPDGWPRSWIAARQYTSTKPWPGELDGVDFNRTLAGWPGGDDMALTTADGKIVWEDYQAPVPAGDDTGLAAPDYSPAVLLYSARAAALHTYAAVTALSGKLDALATQVTALQAAVAALTPAPAPAAADLNVTGTLHLGAP